MENEHNEVKEIFWMLVYLVGFLVLITALFSLLGT